MVAKWNTVEAIISSQTWTIASFVLRDGRTRQLHAIYFMQALSLARCGLSACLSVCRDPLNAVPPRVRVPAIRYIL